ncbi:hypothetical protein RG963_03225 [Methanosarcina sp. Z-7115]|uniref:Uncharacterized protein n=1 Tax=Methanosarcina baikalica TaxID=3073890 RepID=A0ABU2CYP0_9EURY|nr:hypothetical protein [Methanosarcina sp. Z-7115]MDR7664811.1 hypothetical protein [Methanosarcina sp. Z-7115]
MSICKVGSYIELYKLTDRIVDELAPKLKIASINPVFQMINEVPDHGK